MARKTKADLIAELKEKEDALKKRRQALEAATSQEARKLDARRKIVWAGALWARCEFCPELAALVRRELPLGLTKDRDRELLADWLQPAGNNERAKKAAQRMATEPPGAEQTAVTVNKEAHATPQPPPESAAAVALPEDAAA